MMKRLVVTLAATTLVLGGCTPEDGGSQHKNEQHTDPIVELYTNVPDRCAPYTVSIRIDGGSGLNPRRTWTIAQGPWTDKFSYKSGKHLDVTLAILDARQGCALTSVEINEQMFGCRIEDGDHKIFRSIRFVGSVVCSQTTRR